MDEEQNSPEKPAIPRPDIPKPTIALPQEVPAKPSGPPPVKVTIREPGDLPETAAAGGNVPFNTRVLAALIDVLVGAGLQISALWILPSFADRIAWLTWLAYLLFRDSLPFLDGRSIGKQAMKMRVVTLDGQPVTGKWETAVLRNIALAIPFFPLVELFVLLSREDKPGRGLRLGDEWAKTKVIVFEKPAPPTDS